MPVRSALIFNSKPKVAGALLAGAALAASIGTVQSGLAASVEDAQIPWIGLWKAQIASTLIYASLIPIILLLLDHVPLRAGRFQRSLSILAAAGVLLAALKEMLFVAIGDYFRPGIFHLSEILAGDFVWEVGTIWALISATALLRSLNGETPGDGKIEPGVSPVCETPITVREGSRTVLVPRNEIERAEAQGNYVLLHTATGRHMMRTSLAALERELGPQWVRIHRGHILNPANVREILWEHGRPSRIRLATGVDVPVGRSFGDTARRLAAG